MKARNKRQATDRKVLRQRTGKQRFDLPFSLRGRCSLTIGLAGVVYTPEQIAVVDAIEGRRISYRDLNRRACAIARWLGPEGRSH